MPAVGLTAPGQVLRGGRGRLEWENVLQRERALLQSRGPIQLGENPEKNPDENSVKKLQ